MKKTAALLLVTLFFVLCLTAPVQGAEFDLVITEEQLLTNDEYWRLNDLADEIAAKYQCEVSIVAIGSGSEQLEEFAEDFYQSYDYGYGPDASGLMLLLATADRNCVLIGKGYGNIAFTPNGREVLLEEHVLPLVSAGKYYDAFSTFLNKASEYLELAAQGTPFDPRPSASSDKPEGSGFGVKLAITILAPLFIAFIVTAIFRGQMKTAVSQRAASNYIPENGFNLTRSFDNFLYRTEKRETTGGSKSSPQKFSGTKKKF